MCLINKNIKNTHLCRVFFLLKSFTYIMFAILSCKSKHNLQSSLGDFPSSKKEVPRKNPINLDSIYDNFRDSIISSCNQNSNFKLNLSNDTELIKLEAIYLGSIITKSGNGIKFLNTIQYYQLKKYPLHASSGTFLFNKQNKRIGNYWYSSDWELPKRIAENSLVFSYNNSYCKYDTSVSFYDSIPSFLFVPCSKFGGNIYDFYRNE